MIERPLGRAAVIAAALGTLLFSSCEQKPEDYDFHGPPPDAPGIDTHGTSDVGGLDLVRPDEAVNVDGTKDLGEARLDLPAPEEVEPQDFGQDQTAVVPNVRKCTWRLSYQPPDGSAVFLAGEFTGWAENQVPLADDDGDGTWELDFDMSGLAPGSYGYKLHTASDLWTKDPSNPMSKWVDGFENSKLLAPDCKLPELTLDDWSVEAGKGSLSATISVANSAQSAGIQPATAKLFVNGKKQPNSFLDVDKGVFDIKLTGLAEGSKVTLRASVGNEFGQSEELVFPVWIADDGWTWQDAAMYFAFTDRFSNGDKGNDSPANCTAEDAATNWHGGDFAGIRKKIEEDYFTDLGVNVLWISPVVDNPDGCMSGSLQGVVYTAYHGYFPLDIETTDLHFGTLDELRDLVNAAHDKGIRVLVDFVANHVHEDSALYKQHSQDGWFYPFTPCEPAWDKPIECWFQAYLPDLDYTNDAVVETFTNNALYWIREAGVDGFRVDAVKHMVHNFMLTLRWKIEHSVVTEAAPFYMVGETFMGEWGGGEGLAETVIKEYVNPWELNGQFDFPFYWKILKSVARDEGTFSEFSTFLAEALGYWGKDSLMASFIGNHDVPRFVSHAAGQIEDMWGNGSKLQGLNSPPPQPTAAEPYERLRLAIGLIFTLPEIPMLYYGDEVGLAGAGDPDNRRDMAFDALSAEQTATLEFTRQIGAIRQQTEPLRRGSLNLVKANADTLVFFRESPQGKVVVAANRSGVAQAVEVGDLPSSTLKDLLSGKSITASGGKASLDIPARGLMVLVAD